MPKSKHEKQDEAIFRQGVRDGRSDSQQIKHLKGAGHGHCKEVTRLKGGK